MHGSLERLANPKLLEATHALVRRGHAVEAELLRHLGEIDARRLYLGEACSSMFVYCVRVLHFSEAAAYKRIRAARAARRHPELLGALRRGELHVTAVSLLAVQLSDESCGPLIRAARHQTAEQIKRLLADRQPKPDVADCVRRVASPAHPGNAATAAMSEPAETPALNCADPGPKPALVSDRAAGAPSGSRLRSAGRSYAGTAAAAAMSPNGAGSAAHRSSWSFTTSNSGPEPGRIRSTASRCAVAHTTSMPPPADSGEEHIARFRSPRSVGAARPDRYMGGDCP